MVPVRCDITPNTTSVATVNATATSVTRSATSATPITTSATPIITSVSPNTTSATATKDNDDVIDGMMFLTDIALAPFTMTDMDNRYGDILTHIEICPVGFVTYGGKCFPSVKIDVLLYSDND